MSVTQEGGTSRAILIQDFNGFFVKLVQRDIPKAPEAIGAAPGPYITGVTIGVTITAFFRV